MKFNPGDPIQTSEGFIFPDAMDKELVRKILEKCNELNQGDDYVVKHLVGDNYSESDVDTASSNWFPKGLSRSTDHFKGDIWLIWASSPVAARGC